MDPLVVEDLRADPARYPKDHQMISAYPSHVLILIQKAGSRGIRLIRLLDSLEDMIQNDEDHRMQRCNQQGPAPQSKRVFGQVSQLEWYHDHRGSKKMVPFFLPEEDTRTNNSTMQQ